MTDLGRALVLGGGGVTGVAWEVGLIHGLAECGVELAAADLFVGTSAGSVVAAQVAAGRALPEMYAQELADKTGDRNAAIHAGTLLRFAYSSALPGDRRRGRAWLGRAALKADTVEESARRAAIMTRVTSDDWPAGRLRVPAVVASTGEVKVFDNDSGVSLIDAVAASCAVPLVWPPMTVGGTRYIDGGVRSIANVDLASGYGRVVVIAPSTLSLRRRDRPQEQAAALGVPHAVVSPDAPALRAIGRNPLDPDHRAEAAEAGLAQATREAGRIREIWG